jgi:hypothetical protein
MKEYLNDAGWEFKTILKNSGRRLIRLSRGERHPYVQYP